MIRAVGAAFLRFTAAVAVVNADSLPIAADRVLTMLDVPRKEYRSKGGGPRPLNRCRGRHISDEGLVRSADPDEECKEAASWGAFRRPPKNSPAIEVDNSLSGPRVTLDRVIVRGKNPEVMR